MISLISHYYEVAPYLFYFSLFVVGLCIGSFLNVVILRLPKIMEHDWLQQCLVFLMHRQAKLSPEEQKICPCCQQQHAESAPIQLPRHNPFSLLLPRSHCPHCKNPLAFFDNLPLISYLFLKGKCRTCGSKISLRYPVIELFAGLLPVVLLWNFASPSAVFFTSLLLLYALLVLACIDLDHQFLPDSITLTLLWLGLLVNLHNLYCTIDDAVLGAVLGYACLWLVFHVYKFFTGKEGMGYGDFKLLAMLGAWLGWQVLPLTLLLASLLGSVAGLWLIGRGNSKNTPFAFGPYLALAGTVALLYGDEITYWYLMKINTF